MVPTDDVQGAVAADYAKEIGAKKVFVLNDREVYGKGVAGVFEKRAREIGLEVVGVDGIDPKASNYKSLVTKMKQAGADLVYFGGTTQTNAGQLAKDIVSGGLKAKLIVPDGCYENAFIEAAGAKALLGISAMAPLRFSSTSAAYWRAIFSGSCGATMAERSNCCSISPSSRSRRKVWAERPAF